MIAQAASAIRWVGPMFVVMIAGTAGTLGCSSSRGGAGPGKADASGGAAASGFGGVRSSGTGGAVTDTGGATVGPSGTGGGAAAGGLSGSGGLSGTGGTGGSGGGSVGGGAGSGLGARASGGASAGGSGGVGGGLSSPPDAATDIAATDAPANDSGPPVGCAGMFCEDFESGSIDPSVWNVKTSGGQTVAVQKTTVAHGLYAAQFHAAPNVVSYDLIVTKNAPVGLRGHHFGRAYFNVTPKPPAAHTVFLFAGSAGFPKFKYLEVAGTGTTWQLTSVNLNGVDANSASLPGTTEAYSGGGSLPLAKWICLEWEFNDAPDQIRVFVNGTEDFAFTNIVLGGLTTGQVGGFTDFGFGYYAWHPASYPFDVYYDDIVLDTKRVGCLP